MSEKFTKGPWTIPEYQWDDDSPEDLKNCIRIADSKKHYDVAYISIDEHQEGNANLVLAAPDLYEALKDCIEALTHIESMGMRVNPPTLEKAKAALAKAAP